MENPTQPSGRKLSKVFIYASIIVGIMVFLGALFPDRFGQVTGNVGSWVIEYFGWYYLIITTLMVFFCIFLVFSPIGKLKLGKPYHKPEFRTISWLAMLFSAGMGIGLVFYGAAEPIQHYMGPPTADPETDAAMVEALRSTFFHYGFHAWAMYGVVALALAYSQFRKGEVGLLSKTLRPILGDRVDGPIGIAVDVLSVFATIIGVAVSLGVGTLQINGGLNYLFGLPINIMVQGIIIAVVTFLFLISAWSGLSKGIQYLSNLNMGLAGILLIAVLILGPTMMILNMMNTSTGVMLDTFLYNSLDVAPLNQQKSEWLEVWTIYYWGWWMSWSPFVGIFIARVSRGRSVREFVLAVLLVPTLVSIVWFSVFGVTGIEVGKTVPAIFDMNAETMLFGIFNELPLSMVLSVIALLLVSSFFVTSADSATYVLGMQTAFGSLQPSNKIKIVWGIALSSIAFVLLLSGGDTGLAALQSAAIISAFPFSFIIISMMVSFYKDANEERKYLGLSITPNRQRMKDYIEKSKRERAEEIKAEQEAGHEHQ
ncbi:BCCT family transporter [Salinicoccus roseus]|uniref:BCCT family transporter n=1 Tax=Salinicoccus roseus TaxID=45670 RepID=UPI001EF4CFDD|nr:BCCT family transporter [Salinicoccus roseus]MCG7331319.1 BCCT family transporter [Salinicoccus roseus]